MLGLSLDSSGCEDLLSTGLCDEGLRSLGMSSRSSQASKSLSSVSSCSSKPVPEGLLSQVFGEVCRVGGCERWTGLLKDDSESS